MNSEPFSEFDIDFDELSFEEFQPLKSDKFRIAFSSHMVELGDEARAYSRALADCGIRPPPAKALKSLGQEFAKDFRVRTNMSEIRVRITDSYVERLQDHMDKLAELRDMASAEGKYAPAVTAEIARGKAQGFYNVTSDDKGDGDAKTINEDDLKRRVIEALERREQQKIEN